MSDFTRRTLVRGAAWSTPVILAVSAAPAFATSLRKDPGINGWLQVGTSDRGRTSYDLTFDSTLNQSGPDGAPFGLYTYDPNRNGNTITDTYSNASITLWLRTDRATFPESLTGWNLAGSGSRWSGPTDAGLRNFAAEGDNQQYRGYRFAYNGNVPGTGFTLVAAEERVYLQDFKAFANDVNSADATYWVQRSITVNGVVQSFARRNGDDGPIGNGFPVNGRMAAGGTTTAIV